LACTVSGRLSHNQPILQKIYFDVGQKQIASACGYRAETLNSLKNSSHFKKTHHAGMTSHVLPDGEQLINFNKLAQQ
jgi:hypothetical protein